MEAEIESGDNYLDKATKWVFASEKGTTVFAIYGIGDGTVATPLYACGRNKAVSAYQKLNKILEEAAAQNMGLIAVTHNRALANRVCTRVYDLSTGESWIPETQKLPGASS